MAKPALFNLIKADENSSPSAFARLVNLVCKLILGRRKYEVTLLLRPGWRARDIVKYAE